MKKYALEFIRRGLVASGFGPLVLSVLAFIAGGMNVIYRVERLPLMWAILIHGGVLYASYLGTYLINGWLAWGMMPILAFSVIFATGYLAVWAVIYTVTKKNTARLNEALRHKHRMEGDR